MTRMRKSTVEMVATFAPEGVPHHFAKVFEEDKALAMQSEEAAKAFLERATDVEALHALSELSLIQPLNDVGYHLMMHLSFKVFSRAGIPNIPSFVTGHEELPNYYLSQLDQLKRDLRRKLLRRPK